MYYPTYLVHDRSGASGLRSLPSGRVPRGAVRLGRQSSSFLACLESAISSEMVTNS
jgi:hypothetical protein